MDLVSEINVHIIILLYVKKKILMVSWLNVELKND